MEEISKIVARLFTVGERLPRSLRQEIVERAEEAEPLLIAIVDDDSVYPEESRGEGYAPLHALKLLGEIKSTAAIPSMLRVVSASDHLDMAYSQAIHALRSLGENLLEPGLAAHAATADQKLREALAEALAGIAIRDERIFDLLVDLLPRNLTLGAMFLLDYGDQRALPHLCRALDDYVFVKADTPLANQDVIELCAAIERFGGQLTESQQRKLRRVRAVGDRFRAAFDHLLPDDVPEHRPVLRPGRNEPCHCGSGQKYKKCHLLADAGHALI
jgi:hypothetical protein